MFRAIISSGSYHVEYDFFTTSPIPMVMAAAVVVVIIDGRVLFM